MGEIRIYNKEDIRPGLSEALDDGLGEPGIFGSDHKAEMLFCFLKFPDQFNGPVRGIIVNDENFTIDCVSGKNRIHALNNCADVGLFLKCGNNNGQVIHRGTHRSKSGFGKKINCLRGICSNQPGIILKPHNGVTVRIGRTDIPGNNIIDRTVAILR